MLLRRQTPAYGPQCAIAAVQPHCSAAPQWCNSTLKQSNHISCRAGDGAHRVPLIRFQAAALVRQEPLPVHVTFPWASCSSRRSSAADSSSSACCGSARTSHPAWGSWSCSAGPRWYGGVSSPDHPGHAWNITHEGRSLPTSLHETWITLTCVQLWRLCVTWGISAVNAKLLHVLDISTFRNYDWRN